MPTGRGLVFKPGKQAPTYDHRDLRFGDFLPISGLPNFPSPSGGYGYVFPVDGGWKMLGNGPCDDGSINSTWAAFGGAGDCFWAGSAHEEMEMAHNAGRPIPQFTCLNILEQYAAYCNYNLQTGANDQGTMVRDGLQWRATKGLLDVNGNAYKIGAYYSLEVGNHQQLWEALYLGENIGIGIQFPESAMTQFNNRKPWSVVAGTQIEGGHYVPLVGHPSQGMWTAITWGSRQMVTDAFLTTYLDEAWGYISPDRYNRVTGETLQHYKDADLEKYFALLFKSVS
jgi:hypothetical protein